MGLLIDSGRATFRLTSGQYYGTAGPNATSTRLNGYITLTPYRLEVATTFDRIAVEVTTAGESASVVRLGVYADDGSGKPGTLLFDAGTVATATTGVKTITINQSLGPGVYWLAACWQSAPTTQPALRALATTRVPGAPVVATNFSSGVGWGSGFGGQAGLPSSGSGIASLAAGDTSAVVLLRAA